MIESPSRWYCLSSSGIATLCANEIDARKEAVLNNQNWPNGAPHRAVQLVDFAELAAERERCFYWGSLGDHDGYTTHHIQAGTPVPDGNLTGAPRRSIKKNRPFRRPVEIVVRPGSGEKG